MTVRPITLDEAEGVAQGRFPWREQRLRRRLVVMKFRNSALASVFLSAFVLGGCSSGSSNGEASESGDASANGGDASNVNRTNDSGAGENDGSSSTLSDGGTTTTPADAGAFPALPQVVTLGGPTMKTPKVLPIFYSTDANISAVKEFLQELTTTTFWSQTTSEYGIGPISILAPVMITTPAPSTISDNDIAASVATNTTGSNPPWGAVDSDTIYMFVLPNGTVEEDSGGACCTGYDGYHDETPVGSINVPYAVSCACPQFDGPDVSNIDQLTVAMSHELVESSTDPFPNSAPAYSETDENDYVWSLVTGGELADMCEYNADSYALPAGAKHMVQSSWSNAAAKAFKKPCVPIASSEKLPYFSAAAVLTDSLEVEHNKTLGVQIPIGQSKTIDVPLYATGPTSGPWMVSVWDYEDLSGNTPTSTVTLDKSTGSSGDVLHLTITPIASDPTFKGEAFLIFSDLGDQETMTIGYVGN
jgi:hypothetical protein